MENMLLAQQNHELYIKKLAFIVDLLITHKVLEDTNFPTSYLIFYDCSSPN